MTLKPLEIPKKGLAKLSQKTKAKRDELKAKLSQSEIISSADEQWLDGDGNLVDDVRHTFVFLINWSQTPSVR
jgi:hypothetical protein